MDRLKKLIRKTSISNKGNRIGSSHNQRETDRPLVNTSGPFTYTWIVKNFQDLYNQKCLEYYYSDPFTSPSTNEQVGTNENLIETIENTTFTISTNKIEHKWRLLLYPHGHRSKRVKTHISLYLSAIQSQFEKENNIKTRTSRWRFEILRMNNEIEKPKNSRNSTNSTVTTGLSRLNCYRNVLEKQFIFSNDKEPTWGSVKFCEFETIFPNNLDSKFNLIRMEKVDLIIQVHYFDENYVAINYDLEILKIDISLKYGPKLDEYFDNERFSDVIFKFDCGSQLYASRLVLASRSIYFKTMFNGEWIESKSLAIHVKDVEYKIFKIIVYFLYTGILEDGLTFDTLVNVYAEADMREIDELAKVIISRVLEMVNKDNWDDVLLLGWATDNYWLKDQALMYIHSRWEELKDTERMKKVLMFGNEKCIQELMSDRCFGIVNE
ncbi:5931_t:CDS:1 [Dentiscutata heterogama]|uniref:5931_t:CDS:1 n=1 Tax=Dentiscutata heterogama TaxID=1316150 RepID=A0ACA9KHE1_9GLOM|nr:5931_t:CDS:1 [Dentiscutata heterogama]